MEVNSGSIDGAIQEIAPGIISLPLCTPSECIAVIAAANDETNQWMRATVADYEIGKGKIEILDTTSRNGLVKAYQQIPAQCAAFEARAQTVFHQVLKTKWSLPPLSFEDTQLVMYKTGGFFKKHTDWGKSHPRRCISLALYLNDEYDGGELVFPLLDFHHKPTIGECVAFPSDYLHSGEPLKSGTKYVFLSFMCSLPSII